MRALVIVIAAAWLAACTDTRGVEVSTLTLNDAPPSARMRAGYVSVTNHGDTDRRLVGASSTAFGKVEFHRSTQVNGQARMRREEVVEVPAGATVTFEPFGLHLMLMMPVEPAPAPADIAVELCFDNGECITSRIDAP